MPRLRLIHPAIGEFAFRLASGERVVLGRAGGQADFELNWDVRVSRRHAAVFCREGRVFVEDLGSTNGSWYETTRLEGAVQLTPGTCLLLGETVLEFPEDAETTADAPPADEITQPTGMALPESRTPKPSPVKAPSAQIPEALLFPREETRNLPPPDSLERTADIPKALQQRREVRVLDSRRVEVRFQNRKEFQTLWTKDLSKGGLFVEIETPPPLRTEVEVRLILPEGQARLRGTVVHRTESGEASPAGMGLELAPFSPEDRRALDAYVSGDGLPSFEATPSASDAASDADRARCTRQMAEIGRFLDAIESGDLYQALGASPLAPTPQVLTLLERATGELLLTVESDRVALSPAQSRRVQALRDATERFRRLLRTPETRLVYDFRLGHVHAVERLRMAQERSGPDVRTLREAWNHAAPKLVQQAAMLTRQAFEARQRRDLPSAIKAGRAALKRNPFFQELRETVEAWELQLEQGGS